MSRIRSLIIGGVVVLLLIGGMAYEIVRTQPVRGALRTCSELFTAANRPDLRPEERIATARALCTRRYLSTHKLDVARDGQGLVGIPRNLNKNFKAWREGPTSGSARPTGSGPCTSSSSRTGPGGSMGWSACSSRGGVSSRGGSARSGIGESSLDATEPSG